MFCTCSDITIAIATKEDVNAMLCVKILHQLVALFKSYFVGTFNEAAVRRNFVLIYELLGT